MSYEFSDCDDDLDVERSPGEDYIPCSAPRNISDHYIYSSVDDENLVEEDSSNDAKQCEHFKVKCLEESKESKLLDD